MSIVNRKTYFFFIFINVSIMAYIVHMSISQIKSCTQQDLSRKQQESGVVKNLVQVRAILWDRMTKGLYQCSGNSYFTGQPKEQVSRSNCVKQMFSKRRDRTGIQKQLCQVNVLKKERQYYPKTRKSKAHGYEETHFPAQMPKFHTSCFTLDCKVRHSSTHFIAFASAPLSSNYGTVSWVGVRLFPLLWKCNLFSSNAKKKGFKYGLVPHWAMAKLNRVRLIQ